MRLIDADRLLEILEYNKKEKIDEYGDVHQLTAVDINAMISCINNQPTAYDVDKVVVRLEAHAEMNLQKGMREYLPDEARPYLFAYKEFDEAIEIVKAGGIDE